MSANGIDEREDRIDANNWTLFDRLMYGGLGYGAFCLPTNFFKIMGVFLIIGLLQYAFSDKEETSTPTVIEAEALK